MDQETDEALDRPNAAEAAVLQRIIGELTRLSTDSRRRLVDTVCTFFRITRDRLEPGIAIATSSPLPSPTPTTSFRFSDGEAPSPKAFMRDKAPQTDVERVACLAYYLTHHRSMPHFRTKDINDLNTEAAQRRFSNPGFAVTNATNGGYLVPSVKGHKQLSASGESFVEALPDRDAARELLARSKPHRGPRRSRNGTARGSSAQG